MRSLIFSICLLLAFNAGAQETNSGKKMYARSVLNQKGPELFVQQWLTKVPDTRGKWVLYDYSATWCHACRKAMPELNELQMKYADKLVVIFITKETPAQVRAARNFLVEVPTAIDTLGKNSELLQIKGIPHNVLVDPKGYVRWEGFPATKDAELTEEVLVSLFNKYSVDARQQHFDMVERKTQGEILLNGPVSKITELNYTASGDLKNITMGHLLNKKVTTFNENGGLLSESFYNAGDTILNRTTVAYRAKGQPSERICYNQDNSVLTRIVYKYYNDGNLAEESVYNGNNELEGKTVYNYSSHKMLLGEKHTDAHGAIIYRTEYRYDARNNLTDKKIFDGKGKLCSRYAAVVKNGKIVEESVYNSEGLLHRYTHSYNQDGKPAGHQVFNADNKLTSVYNFNYDGSGNLVEEKVNYPNGDLVIKYNHVFDGMANKLASFRFDPNGEIYKHSWVSKVDKADQITWDYYNQSKMSTRFVNTFDNIDDHGNWWKRTKVSNDRANAYTVRQIDYHRVFAKYRINGTTDLKEGIAILNDYVNPDTVKIVNGKFSFTGATDRYNMISIQVPPSRSQRIIIEPGDITVEHDSKTNLYRLGGSNLNTRFQKIEDALKPNAEKSKEMNALYAKATGEERTRLWWELDKLRKQKFALLRYLITSDDSYAGFMQSLTVMNSETAENVKRYLDLFKRYSDDPRYKRLEETYKGYAATDIGVAPPGWTLPDENGQLISLESLKGKYVLVDFWYSGCHWCRKMTPHLKNIYRDLKDKGFEIVSISVDPEKDEDKWRKAMEEDGAPWLQVWDKEKTLPDQYSIWGYPTMFFLDKNGKVLQKIIGYHEEPVLRSFFEGHMFGNNTASKTGSNDASE